MITFNVIYRTFRLKYGGHIGTGFTIDVNGRQYVATARHIVPSLNEGDSTKIEIYHDRQWKALPVCVAWLAKPPADVALLAPHWQLSPANMVLEPTAGGLVYGQQVYFLGFIELEMLAVPGSTGYPMPLVRQGILSGLIPQNGTTLIVIDGHNIRGFSGGPVVFKPPASSEFRVAGVISGYRPEPNPVLERGQPTGMYVHDNTGLVIAYSFEAGIEHISAHPTGAAISSE